MKQNENANENGDANGNANGDENASREKYGVVGGRDLVDELRGDQDGAGGGDQNQDGDSSE